MAKKEHKGGELTNEQLEKDQQIKNQNQRGGYNAHRIQATKESGTWAQMYRKPTA